MGSFFIKIYKQLRILILKYQSTQHNIMYHQFSQGQSNDFLYQNIANKTTVKKDITSNFTPFRGKSKTVNNQQNKQNVLNNQTLPNQISKTTMKKSNSMQKPLTCVNHQDRTAEYSIQIDDQVMNYCNKCAAHLASQGFQVQKIQVADCDRILTIPTPQKNRMIPSNNFKMQQQQSTSNQRRGQLQSFMNQMSQLKQAYKSKKDYLRKISQSYQVEKQTVNNYFSSMIQYLEYLRDEYIQEIQQESIKNTQICEIEAGEMSQTLSQIDEMLIDIDGNIDNIVEQIDEENYVQCFSYYRQKQGIFEHRLQELGTDAKPWQCTSNEQIQQKLDNFKQIMEDLKLN